jgi:hypothetical protein
MRKVETEGPVPLRRHPEAPRPPTPTAEREKGARRRAAEDAGHLGFLLPPCQLELIERGRRAAERRLEGARLPTPKAPESFHVAAAPRSIGRWPRSWRGAPPSTSGRTPC